MYQDNLIEIDGALRFFWNQRDVPDFIDKLKKKEKDGKKDKNLKYFFI